MPKKVEMPPVPEPKEPPPYQTMADILDIRPTEGMPDERLSQSPGLVAIEGSEVPGLGNGGTVQHVQGPGQAPVDPVAAGLDTRYIPKSRNDLRAITQTGTLAAGPRPSTYAEKTGGEGVPQAAPATGETAPAKEDKESLPKDIAEGQPPEPLPTGDPLKGT